MAIKKGKNFSGIVGNTVLRDVDGKQYLQTKPVRVRQTSGTKKSANGFGKASRLAKILRNGLHYCYKYSDGGMVNRFTTRLNSILRDCFDKSTSTYTFAPDSFDRLIGFDFNEDSPLFNSLLLKIKGKLVENKFTVLIPEINVPAKLKFPVNATHCEPAVSICLFSPEASRLKRKNFDAVLIAKGTKIIPAQEFTVDAPEGVLCIVAIGLKYYTIQGDVRTPVRTDSFDPAGICITMVNPGSFSVEALGTEIRTWHRYAELDLGEIKFNGSIDNSHDLKLDQPVLASKPKLSENTTLKKKIKAAEDNKAIEVARNLKTLGLAIEDIAKATGLSTEQVAAS